MRAAQGLQRNTRGQERAIEAVGKIRLPVTNGTTFDCAWRQSINNGKRA
jgi:hypothetical protein